jgi:choline-glycine betaine transporter
MDQRILGCLSSRYTILWPSKAKKRVYMLAHLFSVYLFFPRRQDPEGSNTTLVDWRGKVTLYFTWIFIGCKAVFFFFILFIGIKFSHVKLGHKDEKPEFSTAAFFTMIFA